MSTFAGISLLILGILGAWRHDVPEQRFLDLAREPDWDAVGRVMLNTEHLGSAVLVHPTIVLTDAHVVSTRAGGSTIPVETADLRVEIGGRTVAVAEVRLHPGYWSSTNSHLEDPLAQKGVDVALLRLQTEVDWAAPVTVLPGGESPLGPVTFVGFGTAGSARTVITAPIPSGTKRAGQNVLDQVGGRVDARQIPSFLAVADFDSPTNPERNRVGSPRPTELEFIPVGGDSGGGAFAMRGGEPVLVGLIATLSISVPDDPADGLYGSLAFVTVTSAFEPFVAEALNQRP